MHPALLALFVFLAVSGLASAAVIRIGYTLKRDRHSHPNHRAPTSSEHLDPWRTRHAPPGRHLWPPGDR